MGADLVTDLDFAEARTEPAANRPMLWGVLSWLLTATSDGSTLRMSTVPMSPGRW